MFLSASARVGANTVFLLGGILWLGINIVMGIRFLNTQKQYLALLEKRQGVKMPSLSNGYEQTTSSFPGNLRYLFHPQPDTDCEHSRRLLIRQLIEFITVIVITSLIFFGVLILTS